MVVCCRCNGDGKCKNCVCVKEKRTCTSCLPSRRGKCLNIKQPAASTTTPAQPSTADRELPTHAAVTNATSSSPTTPPQSTTIASSTHPASGKSLFNAHSPTSPSSSSHTPTAPTHSSLPDYPPVMPPSFTWGSVSSADFSSMLDSIYNEVTHWRRNCLSIPFGKAGRGFVNELSRLYLAYGSASALESVALKAAIVFPILLLQKPSRTSKNTLLALKEGFLSGQMVN